MTYALVGNPLAHSWSQRYFEEKFRRESLPHRYLLHDVASLDGLRQWIQQEQVAGFNITIPYKQAILPLLDSLSEVAQAVGAVNCVKVLPDGRLEGHNTDAPAFMETLRPLLQPWHTQALILGTGGAAQAVAYALRQLGIEYRFVSRTPSGEQVSYLEADELASSHYLIVNATPVGMFPHEAATPWRYTHRLGMKHLCYDLVYNPEETRFLLDSELCGAQTTNGLAMLHRQADLSWQIWNE